MLDMLATLNATNDKMTEDGVRTVFVLGVIQSVIFMLILWHQYIPCVMENRF